MKLEIRNNSVHLDGYVNVHSRDSRKLPSPRGTFVEQIMPSAFKDSLHRRSEVALLFNHKADRKLGSTGDNLQLFEDAIGLRAICVVTDEEVVAKAKNGELRGWSFGFIATEQRWEEAEDGMQRRFVDGLDLIEVSILDCTPAYVATTIEARGLVTEQRFEAAEPEVTVVEETIEEPVVEDRSYEALELELELYKLKG